MPTFPFDHGCFAEPIDYFETVLLFLIGIFAVRRISFARAGAANVDAGADVRATYEIGMQTPITREAPVVFAVRQVFKDDRKFLPARSSRQSAFGHVEVHGKAYAILHRNRGLDLLHRGVGGQCGLGCGMQRCDEN